MKKDWELTTRRTIIKAGLLSGVGWLAAGRNGWSAAAKKPCVVCVQGKDPERMVERTFGLLGGIQKFVKPGSKIVIKPNVSFANPSAWGNNTNPDILAACCKLVKAAGARKVLVVDYPLMRGAEALEINGTQSALKDMPGVSVGVLEKKEQFRSIRPPNAKVLKQVDISREVLDADLLINLPVAKAHDAVAASIGLKNLMGVIWDRTAFHTMLEINQAIADLALAVKPGLTLVDMTRIMVTNGPKGPGEIATPNLLVASTDLVAADSFCLTQARFNRRMYRPNQLRYLTYAHKAGLGELDPGKMLIRKENV